MRHWFLLMRLVTLALAVVVPVEAAAQSPALPPLEKLVPSDAVGFASFPSPASARAGFERIPVFAIIQEPEVKQFYESYQEHAERLFESILDPVAKDYYARLNQLDRLFDRQVALALLEPAGTSDSLRFIALLESTGPPEKVREYAESLEKGMARKMFEKEPKRETVGGITIVSLSGSGTEASYALRGSALIVGSDRDAVALLAGEPPKPSLADDPIFAAARTKVSAPKPLFFAYVNLRRIYEIAAKEDPAAFRLNQLAGLTSIQGIAFGLGFDGEVLRDRVFLAMPDGLKGIFKGFSVNPVRPEAARCAPANALALFSLSSKPTEIYRTISELSREKESPLAEAIGRPIDRFEKEMGLQVGKDFVDLLGGEINLYVALPGGSALFPDVVLTADVLDAPRFEKSIDELTRKYLQVEFRDIDFEGWKVHYLAPQGRSGPFSPTYALAGNTLVLSYLPQAVKGALSRLKKQDPGLSGDAEFKKALERAGEAQALGYVNTARTFTYLHSLIVPFSQMFARSSDFPFDPAAVPTAESIAKHLKFSVSVVRTEKTGLFVDSISEGVGPAAFAAYATIVAGALAPNFIRSEARDRSKTCSTRLGMLSWQIRSTEEGPPSSHRPTAEEFAQKRSETREPSWDVWLCPADPKVPEKPEGYSSYAYFLEAHPGKGQGVLDRDFLLVYDKEPRHFGGRQVLLGDWSVRWMDEAEFQTRLRAQIEGKKPDTTEDKR